MILYIKECNQLRVIILKHIFRMFMLMFVAIAYPMVLIITVALIGLFDTWIDFRNRFPFPEEGE